MNTGDSKEILQGIFKYYVKQLKIYIDDYEPELSKEMLGKIKEYIGRG